MKKFTTLLVLTLGLMIVSLTASAANVVLVNLDPPGTGLNDPTPATPVGGNPGTTIGEQRVNVYNRAAEIWGAVLDSDIDILVGATFQPLPCAPAGGVLGAAGPTYIFSDFPNAGYPATWYVSAQADAVSGLDLFFEEGGYIDIDIISFFNSDIDDDDPNCLTGTSWYYGFDNMEAGDIDFLTVVLHEIAHGLGNLELVDEDTGALIAGQSDIYMKFMYDRTTEKTWDEMDDAERLASQVNTENLVWIGDAVTAAAPSFLGPRPSFQILNPKSNKGSFEAQSASFGPPLNADGGMTGKLVMAEPNTACGGPLENKVAGKIVVIDRGVCSFVEKVFWAQVGNAKGAIIANNQPSGRAPMGGSADFITIPSVGVTLDDGNMLKAAMVPNSVLKLNLNPNILSGTSPEGWVRLNAPDPVQPGSSKSHWDPAANPNLLMEPSINSDLESATTLDLTPYLFEDIGWPLQ